ncbi:MAG TPA: YCF48-related protein [Longimicrobiales bacterium]
MKRALIYGCALPLLLAGSLSAQQPGWRISYTVPNRYADDLRSVYFHTRHVGWAVGDGHTNYTGIYHTIDGGKKWERLELFDGQEHAPDFNMVRFADKLNGWIGPSLGNTMLKTTDGGENWEPVQVKLVDHLYSFRLLPLGVNSLLVASSAGQLLRTDDGGDTWSKVLIDEPAPNVMDIVRADANTFYAILSEKYTSSGAVYRSDDGARTWQKIFEVEHELGAIAFKDKDHGVLLGKGAGYWTADGGATWKRTIAPGRRNAVAYVDELLVAVGEDPHVLISKNDGRTWVAGPTLPGAPPQQLHDIAAVDFGWWFAPSDRAAKVYGYFDPQNDQMMGHGKTVIPTAVRVGESGRLPPGTYDVMLRHVGYEHAIVLTLEQPAAGYRVGVKGKLGPKDFACTDCEATLPVEVEYDDDASNAAAPDAGATASSDATAVEATSEKSRFSLKLEPTDDGLAVVINAALLPPLTAARFLTAAGVAPQSEVDVKAATKKDGGVFGRLKKAANGDIKGAVAGASPKVASERIKSAGAATPVFYHIKARYVLPLVPAAN